MKKSQNELVALTRNPDPFFDGMKYFLQDQHLHSFEINWIRFKISSTIDIKSLFSLVETAISLCVEWVAFRLIKTSLKIMGNS